MVDAPHGMVLGKFMPPHRGHQFLIDFARHYTPNVSVVVGTQPSERLDGHLRFQWMREMFPDLNVVHLHRELPQAPEQHPDFWTVWRDALLEVLPSAPELVFASESYGGPLAEILGARFIPVDPDRSAVPISATKIRDNPIAHWAFLPACVREHYALRICVFGPESTGKSTLAAQLAEHFDALLIREYARTYLEQQDGDIHAADMLRIARGQRAYERALIPGCDGIAILDTDVFATCVWAEALYGSCPDEVRHLAIAQPADLYLLLDVDVPWVQDSVRYLPDERESFHKRCREVLEANQCNYVEINGTWDERWAKAISAVGDRLATVR